MARGIEGLAADHFVSSSDDSNIRLYVRERRPDVVTETTPVLFVHGATMPGTVIYDLSVDGYSWLDRACDDGFHAFAMDIRGYGGSTRPPAMDSASGDHPPFARAEEVVSDIRGVVDFVCAKSGSRKVHLVGHSWGTVTTGTYLAKHQETVEKLVLFAPVYSDRNDHWLKTLADRDDPSRISPTVGAYRVSTSEMLVDRWKAQLTRGNIESMLEDHVLEQFLKECMDSDNKYATGELNGFRSPNGVLVDLFEIFSERPVYDPGLINVPTLVVRGTEDTDSTRKDALGLFDALGTAQKHYHEIAKASHFVLLERNAPALHGLVDCFLSDN